MYELLSSCNAATITLTSTVDGIQAACPGEVVTYTCTVIQGNVLEWIAVPFIMSANRLQFSFSTPENTVLACSDSSSAVVCSDFDYRATLTDVGTVQGGAFRDMTSTFRFTAKCQGQWNSGGMQGNNFNWKSDVKPYSLCCR